MKIIIPPCPRCDEEMNETDDCLKCATCGEEQSFSYMVKVEEEQK